MTDDRVLIGNLIDTLGVKAPLAEGDIVESAVVLLKILPSTGPTRLALCNSASLDWIAQLGMVHGAVQILDADEPMPDNEA